MNAANNFGISGQSDYDNFVCFSKACKKRKKEKRETRSERRKIRTERKRARTEQRQLDNENSRIQNESMKQQARQEKKDAQMSSRLARQMMADQATARQAEVAPPPQRGGLQTAGLSKGILPLILLLMVGGFILKRSKGSKQLAQA